MCIITTGTKSITTTSPDNTEKANKYVAMYIHTYIVVVVTYSSYS